MLENVTTSTRMRWQLTVEVSMSPVRISPGSESHFLNDLVTKGSEQALAKTICQRTVSIQFNEFIVLLPCYMRLVRFVWRTWKIWLSFTAYISSLSINTRGESETRVYTTAKAFFLVIETDMFLWRLRQLRVFFRTPQLLSFSIHSLILSSWTSFEREDADECEIWSRM